MVWSVLVDSSVASARSSLAPNLVPKLAGTVEQDAVDSVSAEERGRKADYPRISSAPFKIVLNIVTTVEAYAEMVRRYAGAAPTPFDVDTFRCETIDGRPLDINEVFADSLTSAFRRVIVDTKGVTVDVSERRFFTGIARTALMISHDECEWVGCHVPASRCEGDHTIPKVRGGPTTQQNGTIFCKRHNRHKERGYTGWRDPTTGQLRIKTPHGTEITNPWQ